MRLFTDVIREMRNGALVDELSEKLNELVEAVETTNKVGALTLKIDIKPARGGAYLVADDVKLKKPELDREATIFFVSDAFDLQRNDPNQLQLGIRSVDTEENDEQTEIRKV